MDAASLANQLIRGNKARAIFEKNFRYSIPKDKERLLYDFYVIAYLNQFDFKGVAGDRYSDTGTKVNTTGRRELDTNTQDSFLAAKEKILGYLKPHMLRAVLFAVSAEFRHILGRNTKESLQAFFDKRHPGFIQKYARSLAVSDSGWGDFKDIDRRYKDDKESYIRALEALKESKIDPIDFIALAKQAFVKLNWAPSYGGQPWANICAGWERLYDAKSEDELFVAIDHVYDLQHNTDTVFNKLKSYYRGGYGWIKRALDEKAGVKEPHSLLVKSSPTIKAMTLRIIKSEGYPTWEEFAKSNLESWAKKVQSIDLNDPKPKEAPASKAAKPPEPNLDLDLDDGLDDDPPPNFWDGDVWDGGTWGGGEWYDGVWKNGVWEGGVWHKGTWEDGSWRKGIWKDGHWFQGVWEAGTWFNGTWSGGKWLKGWWVDGHWKNGSWRSGTWKGGTWIDGYWEDGTWKTGYWGVGNWEKGTWEDGVWNTGIWHGGTWKDGTWHSGRWHGGVWNGGEWKNGSWGSGTWGDGVWRSGQWAWGEWLGGTWIDGVWADGHWFGGTWKGGTWKDGLWIYGTWEGGTWEGGWIKDPGSPDEDPAMPGFVRSSVSPAEYFKNK